MSIFGDVEPPRWLQQLTIPREQGELGATLGTALGAGLLALQPDEDGKLKGVEQGIAEARLNQQDPMWKLKEKQLESSVVGNWARAASAWQQYDTQNRDMATWMTEDLPSLRKYQDAVKTDPNTPVPIMKSQIGQGVANQISNQQLRRDMLTFRREKQEDDFETAKQRAFNSSAAAKEEAAHDKKFLDTIETVTDDAERARIREMYKKGEKDNAWAALDAAPKKSKEEKKQEGAVALQELKGDQAVKLAEQKAKEKVEFEQQRQQDRLWLEEAKSKYRGVIEKMKLDAKSNQGKVITEDEFVNRHFTAVFNALVKESGKPEEAARDAGRILRARYRAEHKKAPEAAPAAPAPATTTNASRPTNEDPLGILK